MAVANPAALELFVKEAIFALGIMGAVSICNIYSFATVSLAYRRVLDRSPGHGRHYELFRFVGYILLLMVSMLLSLSIWAAALMYFGFARDWTSALLFTFAFFTTTGSNLLSVPDGWRFIPSIIAFSGLFSFAWATGSSMGMFNYLSRHLEKHGQI